MRRLSRIVVVFSLLFAGLAVGSAASQQGDDARSEHQRIVDFWTVDKVRQAIPRDFMLDAASGRFIPTAKGGKPGRPGGGGGGGGGGSDVTGASWEDGGTVLKTTGKVLFASGGTYYVCSASVVNDDSTNDQSVVLTAAHCAYENVGSPGFVTNWMFIPEWDNATGALSTSDSSFCDLTPYGCWTAQALVVHDGFASAGGFNGTAVQYDFAFAVLGEGGHGPATTLVETLGTQTMSFNNVSKGTQVHAFGYPHAAPYSGDDLVYCAGGVNFDNRMFKLTYKLGCDMTGGSSGGPWGTDFADGDGVLMSVNSYKYSGGNAMYGPKFNTTTEATYNAATSAVMNTIATGG